MISFSSPANRKARLSFFNLQGRLIFNDFIPQGILVHSIDLSSLPSGSYVLSIDLSSLPSGSYVLCIQSGAAGSVRALVVVK